MVDSTPNRSFSNFVGVKAIALRIYSFKSAVGKRHQYIATIATITTK